VPYAMKTYADWRYSPMYSWTRQHMQWMLSLTHLPLYHHPVDRSLVELQGRAGLSDDKKNWQWCESNLGLPTGFLFIYRLSYHYCCRLIYNVTLKNRCKPVAQNGPTRKVQRGFLWPRYCHRCVVTIDWGCIANCIYWHLQTVTKSTYSSTAHSHSAAHYSTDWVLSVRCGLPMYSASVLKVTTSCLLLWMQSQDTTELTLNLAAT
jgi:hypothetical protein